jgi:hypothetical protein
MTVRPRLYTGLGLPRRHHQILMRPHRPLPGGSPRHHAETPRREAARRDPSPPRHHARPPISPCWGQATAAVFLRPDGSPPPEGTLIVQDDLAASLAQGDAVILAVSDSNDSQITV